MTCLILLSKSVPDNTFLKSLLPTQEMPHKKHILSKSKLPTERRVDLLTLVDCSLETALRAAYAIVQLQENKNDEANEFN